jgi:LmbE family N-acetylglucosaminyl deacetylase
MLNSLFYAEQALSFLLVRFNFTESIIKIIKTIERRLIMTKNIFVIGAHPDDELLGSGGAMRKMMDDGYDVISIIVAKGRKEEEHHMQEFIALANRHLGIKEVIFLKYRNLMLETVPLYKINKKIESLIEKYEPEMIFTHHYGDLNRDHQITFEAVLTAARPLPEKKPIDIICFETVSSSEWHANTGFHSFKPNFFVDITNTIDKKLEALRYYDVEMRPYPHPRSYEGIKQLASIRGITIGVQYGEAFEIVRRVWK